MQRVIHIRFGVVALLGLASGCASMGLKDPTRDKHAEKHQKLTLEMMQNFENKRNEMQMQAALTRWRQGDGAGTRELVEKLLARVPEHREARLLKAELMLDADKPLAVIEDIEKLVEQNPNDAEAVHMLALLMEASGHDDEALVQYQRAIELEPDNPVYTVSYQTAIEK